MHKLELIVSTCVNHLATHERQCSCLKLQKWGSIPLNASASPVRHFLYFYFECVLGKKQHN